MLPTDAACPWCGKIVTFYMAGNWCLREHSDSKYQSCSGSNQAMWTIERLIRARKYDKNLGELLKYCFEQRSRADHQLKISPVPKAILQRSAAFHDVIRKIEDLFLSDAKNSQTKSTAPQNSGGKNEKKIASLEAQLSNQMFLARAPKNVVEKIRKELNELRGE